MVAGLNDFLTKITVYKNKGSNMQVELSKEETRIAVNALLAWFATDINIDLSDDDEETMFELAKKLQDANGEKVEVGTLYVVNPSFHDEPYKVKEIQKHFKIREYE